MFLREIKKMYVIIITLRQKETYQRTPKLIMKHNLYKITV